MAWQYLAGVAYLKQLRDRFVSFRGPKDDIGNGMGAPATIQVESLHGKSPFNTRSR